MSPGGHTEKSPGGHTENRNERRPLARPPGPSGVHPEHLLVRCAQVLKQPGHSPATATSLPGSSNASSKPGALSQTGADHHRQR
jgi:hypothetical protein